jgi:hypothetical protein
MNSNGTEGNKGNEGKAKKPRVEVVSLGLRIRFQSSQGCL